MGLFFKWKPLNIHDRFLSSHQKSNGDDTAPIFQPGKSSSDLEQYKHELRCGYSQKNGYLNSSRYLY